MPVPITPITDATFPLSKTHWLLRPPRHCPTHFPATTQGGDLFHMQAPTLRAGLCSLPMLMSWTGQAAIYIKYSEQVFFFALSSSLLIMSISVRVKLGTHLSVFILVFLPFGSPPRGGTDTSRCSPAPGRWSPARRCRPALISRSVIAPPVEYWTPSCPSFSTLRGLPDNLLLHYNHYFYILIFLANLIYDLSYCRFATAI